MQQLPKITIITANYNQGAFIETCIRSVIHQNYANLEYIIIDGKSTDNSVEIIKKYSDQLNYWISEPDKGQTDAINKGIKMATGEIITWLNADDYFLPGALETAARLYLDTTFDFFLGNSIFVDVNGKPLPEQYKSQLIENKIFIPCDSRCKVHQPSSFFSKKIIQQTGLLDEELHYAMDVDLWIKMMALGGQMMYRDVDLTCFRRHNEAKSALGNIPFIEDTMKSTFFQNGLKKLNPSYYKKCRNSVFTCYFDHLHMEHSTGKLFRFAPRLFVIRPWYTVKTLIIYTLLKLKLKYQAIFRK